MQSGHINIDPMGSIDRVYDEEELGFLRAIEAYKRNNKRPYPTWAEILSIARALGYRLVAPPTQMPIFRRGSNKKEI